MKISLEERIQRTELTRLTYWYPKLLEAGTHLNISMPRTEIVPVRQEELWPLLDGKSTEGIHKIVAKCKVAGQRLGYPLFLRTDLVSGKFNWKHACFVDSEKVMFQRIQGVIEENEMIDLLGAPYKALCLRQYIPLHSSFIAFRGGLPIARERRYFVMNGEVVCFHPYWVEGAIAETARLWERKEEWPEEIRKNIRSLPYQTHPRTPEGIIVENWRELLAELNHESPEEVALLSKYARQIGKVLDGYWSVDFAYGQDGQWYIIDLADGYISYHWEGCPHIPVEIHLKKEG